MARSEAMIHLAMTDLMARRITGENTGALHRVGRDGVRDLHQAASRTHPRGRRATPVESGSHPADGMFKQPLNGIPTPATTDPRPSSSQGTHTNWCKSFFRSHTPCMALFWHM